MAEGMVCGTGTWSSNPKPGDPDNNVILTATPAFGGIDVSWTYPEVNPHGVAHTILYRSTNSDPATKVRHRVVTGDYFYDKTTTSTPIEYFYWIQIVSVNGTVGELIGPASATARPTISQMLEMLTAQIDSGALAQRLKTSLAEIDLNKQALYDEMAARAAADESLGVQFNQVMAASDDNLALIQQEIQARTEGDDAVISQMNTLYAQTDTDLAAVRQEMGAFVEQVNGNLKDIGAYFTVVADVNGLIGGFGLYNDGTRVDMGFDVDRFWVGRTKNDGTKLQTKPFIIEGDEVFINEAVINKLTFNKLRDAEGAFVVENGKIKADYLTFSNSIQSANYVPNWTGVRIDGVTGTVEINGAIPGVGRIQITNRAIKVIDTGGIVRVHIGDLTA